MKSTIIYHSGYSAIIFLLLSVTNVSTSPIVKRQILPLECTAQEGGYFIPPNQVGGAEAIRYCQSLGGKLVDVNNGNVKQLTEIVSRCVGGNRNVRIQTWDTNAFGIYDLVLHTGSQAGAGTVGTARANEPLFAICQTLAPPAPFPPPEVDPNFVSGVPGLSDVSSISGVSGTSDLDSTDLS